MINLKKLQSAAIDEFGPLLEKAGFKRTSSKEDKFGFETTFISGEQYVQLYANCNPRDNPPYFNIILGEGPLESPESDWNSVALWRMGPKEGNEYLIDGVSDMKAFIQSAKKDFQLLEQGFLAGDLKAFHRIRAAQTTFPPTEGRC